MYNITQIEALLFVLEPLVFRNLLPVPQVVETIVRNDGHKRHSLPRALLLARSVSASHMQSASNLAYVYSAS
jgi:hypothetical protein